MVYLFFSFFLQTLFPVGITWVLVYRTEKYKRLKAEVEKQSKKRKWSLLFHIKQLFFVFCFFSDCLFMTSHCDFCVFSFYYSWEEKGNHHRIRWTSAEEEDR